MSRTERHAAIEWADAIEAERLACQPGATWAQVDAAIRAHCTHDAGCLADIGTECLMEQALLPTRPGDLHAPCRRLHRPPPTPAPPAADADPHAELGRPALWWLAAAGAIAAGAALSALWPWGVALPLP